ncbi:kar1p [Saccharomyces arboricola H-6]|uniref:Kar1p n=1 Tax=Saccharomyces arboricola (strain H-6 / AS 2.3317 / CBS 10644) TaxID=1160507 RepID=J8PX77_SACAR|nr:kar1p [Saccharomyces arboricola H-6]
MNVTSPKDESQRFSKKNRLSTHRSRFHKLNGHPQDVHIPEDRDSIVSSNTTSIMTDDASDYNGGRTSHAKTTDSDGDGNNNTIKEENPNKRDIDYNPFYSEPGISQRYMDFTKKRQFEPKFVENGTERYVSDEDKVKSDEDDNIENELQFTPRIKEPSILRSSLLKQRNASYVQNSIPKEPQIKFKPVVNNKSTSQRKSSAFLRKQLGKPLPLPYLNNPSGNSTSVLHKKEEVFTDKVAQKKKELIESKWHRLLLHDKKMVEKKLEGLREYERKRMWSQGSGVSNHLQDNSFKASTPTKSYITLEDVSLPHITNIKTPINTLGGMREREESNDVFQFQGQQDPFEKLQSEIETNTRKLDTILDLLKEDTKAVKESQVVNDGNVVLEQGNDNGWWGNMVVFCKKSRNIIKKNKEYFLWTICILILLYCNIYVYYKL